MRTYVYVARDLANAKIERQILRTDRGPVEAMKAARREVIYRPDGLWCVEKLWTVVDGGKL